ncbi:hypothetical protein [Pandoraea iniqua]|uniref:hypothetical protein n=1 Tax=Pandoraea iniqua TaxID=2508288 RepID=UPI00123FD7D8|nr:hypothetical protein [Pandoraea iniqua]
MARAKPFFFLLIFSFSLILKRKEENNEGASEKQGVAKKAKTVAFQRKTVAGSSNEINRLQAAATEPRVFSRYLPLNDGARGGHRPRPYAGEARGSG